MNDNGRAALAALACGLLFGIGLIVSGMTNPAKVIGFLDLFGDWDPSLALVMGGALVVTGVGYRLVWRADRPWAGPRFQVPGNRRIDARLAIGAVLFGIGWGLAGLCPGPAITSLAAGESVVYAFFASMVIGMGLFRGYASIEWRIQDAARRRREAQAGDSVGRAR